MSEREKLVEIMKAGAIAAGKGEPSWADCVTDDEWEAALAALEAAGVRLVPVEITEAQLDAAISAPHPAFKRTVGSVLAAEYKAAVAASPYAKDPGNG